MEDRGSGGRGLVQLRNGVPLLFDGRSRGPRVFQVNGSKGMIYLHNDLRHVQLWKQDAVALIRELQAGPVPNPRQEQSYAVTQMQELLDVVDRGVGQAVTRSRRRRHSRSCSGSIARTVRTVRGWGSRLGTARLPSIPRRPRIHGASASSASAGGPIHRGPLGEDLPGQAGALHPGNESGPASRRHGHQPR